MSSHSSRRRKSRILVIIAVLIIAYVVFDKGIERYRNSVGAKDRIIAKENMKVAPKWKLDNLAGEEFNSEYLEGDVALISFWLSTCRVCLSEISLFKELHEEYKDKGLKIVAISVDGLEDEDLQAFVKAEQIDYIVLKGDSKVTKQFGGIDVVPQTFLVDRKGHIVKYFLGPIDKDEIESLIEHSL